MNKTASFQLFRDSVIFILSMIALVALTLDYGYSMNYWMHLITDFFYFLCGFIFTFYFIKHLPKKGKLNKKPIGYYVVTLLSIILLIVSSLNTSNFIFYDSTSLNPFTMDLVFVLILFDLSSRLYNLNSQTLHPALVFVLSFVVLIFIGTLLLMAPKATVHGINFINALFTSTSAVCVTGLAVLDTGKDFTLIGQLTIMCLIQFGALGMLSFTSLFALFFKGFGSFESRLNIKDMINADTLDGTFKRLIQIIIFVFSAEGIGTLLIFSSLDDTFGTFKKRMFFSVFHSISAFCNAGFSTLSNSLYEEGFRYNYSLQMSIALLIVCGGLGFVVFINIFHYLKKWFFYTTYRLFNITWKGHIQKLKPHISLNSKIVLYTTLSLIVFGTLFFYLLEINNSLQEHSGIGKFFTALFGSITTRTAGFNNVEIGHLHFTTIMIVLFLMWIGASPGSTGGGIKTSTFAIASFNIIQQVTGYKNIIVGYKKISQTALQRATTIISLSLIMIGISTFLLIHFDKKLGIMQIAFECISAFSTVGLSMGITSQLSDASKLVIISTMLIGRVGLLTLLIGITRQFYTYQYSAIEYPREEIFIN
ncbi:potassium transporter TrkG [Flammeovirgaceae bacterium SG7u.111]|nr:potassium transporter TrkG [Flammeovirgaceae bacterium SG7u.132]WPO37759.1 potassium transporter TrkG [Flammeovirgaceae bacterium SG7u.111]